MIKLCPDEEKLGDYIEGRVNDEDRLGIEEHLSECDTCRREFIIGKGLVRGGDKLELDPVPEEVILSALRIVNRYASIPTISLKGKFVRFFNEVRSAITNLFRPVLWGRWGLATIRGSKKVVSEDLVHLRKRFRDLETDIEIERIAKSRRAHIRINITGINSNKEGIRVTLQREKREISSYLSDKRGYVLFEDIPFGHYSLIFKKDKITLGTYPFEIKEA